jgi:type II secretory ATPase GspE/PulE/Tfp pilus assembly ATPase PilB-like protein/ActR/RegA family two-component response regulator
MSEMVQLHWLVTVAPQLGVPAEALHDLAADASALDAWSVAAAAAGRTEEDLAHSVAAHFRLALADLSAAEPRALKLVPEALARRYHVFPLRETDRHLVVATSDPTNLELEQMIGFASGRGVVLEIAPPAAVARAIEEHYSPDRMLENLLQAVDDDEVERVKVVDERVAGPVAAGDAQAAPVVKLANLILRAAVEAGASDIHIEPGRRGGLVRLRVDGVMREYMPLPMPALNRVVSRIKILGGLDIADRLRPQDGRARIRVEGRLFDLRISTVPTRDAEKAVLRILDPESSRGLDDLELPQSELRRIRRLIGFRDGIVLVTGPTGSGKTTTLYAALRELATGEVNIMTVEDPVEYELGRITQIQVEQKRGVTFASALRAILRQDPDVILVGEIRDLETAEIAVQAALTGHLVLATLHANDAAGAVTRLLDLGLDRTVVADALRGALAQRLARRVCQACAAPVGDTALSEDETELAARYGVRPEVRAVGCPRCLGTGYRGRIVVLEVATVTEGVRALIARAAPTGEIHRAVIAGGMRPMRDVAVERASAGITTLAEIDRTLGDAGEAVTERGDAPHVLLLDDDGVVRSLARSLLEKHGCRVSEATDGAAGMARLSGPERFDLLVLDLAMPRLGGREVLGRVRADVATAALPVIVLTGSDDQDLEVALMEEGADDYIRKPVDPARFVARVKGALRRAASG